MTSLAERVQRITNDLDCGLGDLDAVKCRLRETLAVVADVIGHVEMLRDEHRATRTHARVEGAADTTCGLAVTPDVTTYTYFVKGRRDPLALNSVDCPACRANVLMWPEYHPEWEQAAGAHAKAQDGGGPPRVTPRQAQNRLDAWRSWLLEQPIAQQVAQEHLDDLARSLAAIKRPP